MISELFYLLPIFLATTALALAVFFGAKAAIARFRLRNQDSRPAVCAETERRLAIFERHGIRLRDGEWVKVDSRAGAMIDAAIEATKPKAVAVDEPVSVLLRRQIPPCYPASSRSWLGGLPSMPNEVDWPIGVNPEEPNLGPIPLHFIAQICCADLPPETWGGLGPREGWMLLFANEQTYLNEDGQSARIIYTKELGQERSPPAGIGPISAYRSEYMGWRNSTTTYPRWPVDLVVVTNTNSPDEMIEMDASRFDSTLYPDQPVASAEFRRPNLGPFSLRVLRTGLKCTEAFLENELLMRDYRSLNFQSTWKQFEDQGGIERIFKERRDYQERASERLRGALQQELGQEEIPAELFQARATADELLQRSKSNLNEISALGFLGTDIEKRFDWILSQSNALTDWQSEVLLILNDYCKTNFNEELDRPVSEADWENLAQLSNANLFTNWSFCWDQPNGPESKFIDLRKEEHSIIKLAARYWESEAQRLAPTYYLDPKLRHMLPEAAIPALEAIWRRTDYGRPHRIGGHHDGVQSGSNENLLLLQLATDDAMNFMWGDCGCIYAFISADALKLGDMSAATVHVEGH